MNEKINADGKKEKYFRPLKQTQALGLLEQTKYTSGMRRSQDCHHILFWNKTAVNSDQTNIEDRVSYILSM